MRSPRHGVLLAERATAKVGVALRPSTVKTLQRLAALSGVGVKGKGQASVAALIVESYAQGKYFCSCGSIHALPECHQEGK
jgi:hypothetical protein